MTHWTRSALIIALVPLLMGADKSKVEADKRALAPLQAYVGSWKGVGRPRRGSSKGAWTEKVSWSWTFDDEGAHLAFTSEKGKFFKSGVLSPDEDEGEFILKAVAKNGKKEKFKGKVTKKGLVLRNRKAEAGRPARLTLRTVADGDRLIVLVERNLGGTVYSRMAEIGYTRKGGGFAKGAKGPECIVTGGKGTTVVTYKGKSYYVCCSGCKDLFDQDPAGCIAEAAKRKKK